jgi:hypothetical protein
VRWHLIRFSGEEHHQIRFSGGCAETEAIPQFLAPFLESSFGTDVEVGCMEDGMNVGNPDIFDFTYFGCQSA